MPDYPPLSQLPGFIPAPKPGTPEFKAFVAKVFTNPSANAAFAEHVMRLTPSPHTVQHTPTATARLEKATTNAP